MDKMSTFDEFVHQLQALSDMLPCLTPSDQRQAAALLEQFTSCVSSQYLAADQEQSKQDTENQPEDEKSVVIQELQESSKVDSNDDEVQSVISLQPCDQDEQDILTEVLYQVPCSQVEDFMTSEVRQKSGELSSQKDPSPVISNVGSSPADDDDSDMGSTNEHTKADLCDATLTTNEIKHEADADGVFNDVADAINAQHDHLENNAQKSLPSENVISTSKANLQTIPVIHVTKNTSDIKETLSTGPVKKSTFQEVFVEVLRTQLDSGTENLVAAGPNTVQNVLGPNNALPDEVANTSASQLTPLTQVPRLSLSSANSAGSKLGILKHATDGENLTPKSVTFAVASPMKTQQKEQKKIVVLTIPPNEQGKRRGRPPKQKADSSNKKKMSLSCISKNRRRHISYDQDKCMCRVCGKILNNPSNLQVHLRTHSGSRPYACMMCPQTFTTKANLRRHEASHAGIKQFGCQLCGRSFLEKKSLDIHMRRHTGEKPHVCKICGKMFRQSTTLHAHGLTHLGERKHVCDVCGNSYSMASALQKHKKKKHVSDQAYQCDVCSKLFLSESDVRKHLLVHEGKKYICEFCDRKFFYIDSYKSHVALHRLTESESCTAAKSHPESATESSQAVTCITEESHAVDTVQTSPENCLDRSPDSTIHMDQTVRYEVHPSQTTSEYTGTEPSTDVSVLAEPTSTDVRTPDGYLEAPVKEPSIDVSVHTEPTGMSTDVRTPGKYLEAPVKEPSTDVSVLTVPTSTDFRTPDAYLQASVKDEYLGASMKVPRHKAMSGLRSKLLSAKAQKQPPVMVKTGEFVLVRKGTSPASLRSAGLYKRGDS